jgi:hypothetical protein
LSGETLVDRRLWIGVLYATLVPPPVESEPLEELEVAAPALLSEPDRELDSDPEPESEELVPPESEPDDGVLVDESADVLESLEAAAVEPAVFFDARLSVL